MDTAFELFHLIVDAGSAQARKVVVERGLDVKFRNVAFEKPEARLKELGGDGTVPALWDGEKLHVGTDAVLARLRA